VSESRTVLESRTVSVASIPTVLAEVLAAGTAHSEIPPHPEMPTRVKTP
jgi:hypothetical protein